MWYLTKLALRNRAVTLFLAAVLTAASVWATLQLKMEMIPNIELPFTMVFAAYPNASPDEVVEEVTAPIEDAMWERWHGRGLKQLVSTSSDGISVVFANFEYGTDMAGVQAAIRTDIAVLDLPEGVTNVPLMNPAVKENPQVVDINFNLLPLVVLTLNGDMPVGQLNDIVGTRIVPALEDIEGVAIVEMEGGQEDQVLISPEPQSLSEHSISMYQIAALLSLGSHYDSLEGLETSMLGASGVALGEIAEITQGPSPRSVVTRTDGKPSVSVSVRKEDDANTVDVGNAVMAKAEELQASLANEYGDVLELVPVFDQSEFIERSIGELARMALIGAGLAIIVVFLFLMAFRASLVTAMSIPMSVLIGFLIMKFTGVTINLLTLSAMAIAVGRLIDNSIVVSEVIYRRLKQGEGFKEAAIGGAREVATPITASTLATVAIFVPLAFVGGIVGEMFIPFALTITFALVASLIVALMIVPAFAGWFGGRKETGDAAVPARDAWYQRLYVPTLRWSLSHRVVVLVVTAVLFFGSLALIPVVGTSFLPSMTEKMIMVSVEMPSGTALAATDSLVAQVEDVIDEHDGMVEVYHTTVGTSATSLTGAMSAAFGGGDNTAEITIMLDPDADLEKERDDLERAIRELPGAGFVTVETGEAEHSAMMGYSGLDISVRSDTHENLSVAVADLSARLDGIEGITNLQSELTMVVPRLVMEPDQARLVQLGLTPQQMDVVTNDLYLLRMGGEIPGVSVGLDGEDYSIFLRGVARELYDAEDPEALARSLVVGWPASYSLGDVADVALEERPTHVSHTDLRMSATISGVVTEKDVGAVNRAIQEEIDDVLAGPGMEDVEIKMGGVAEEMTETFSKMGFAIIAAIVIAYLVIVVSMRSFLDPVIIMVSLPLASIGALLGLLVTGNTLGVSGMMGMLMLVGIVLTNAIVLIDLVRRLRKNGARTYDALIEGGRTRLRPILMTALTTMIAMVPLAVGVGEGTLLAAELAVVVIGGLFTSTLLTLVVIPVIYSLADSARQRVRALPGGQEPRKGAS
jgi:HAE1 family hydrophobic/amphiphilic exporter-1